MCLAGAIGRRGAMRWVPGCLFFIDSAWCKDAAASPPTPLQQRVPTRASPVAQTRGPLRRAAGGCHWQHRVRCGAWGPPWPHAGCRATQRARRGRPRGSRCCRPESTLELLPAGAAAAALLAGCMRQARCTRATAAEQRHNESPTAIHSRPSTLRGDSNGSRCQFAQGARDEGERKGKVRRCRHVRGRGCAGITASVFFVSFGFSPFPAL
ncbi:hypothetical protein B0T25DRAFT_127189 [Lasiosphaeria hispida]|uniref:Uncharacterized protein n=1 Tax=Lasiosphaeria hispida TaxID=260671 RepID=A0AAJ0HS99_9PEZI|nr:hypothetical protein B0T25DRAFT_127189 [Lasiosphaeria hispida]